MGLSSIQHTRRRSDSIDTINIRFVLLIAFTDQEHNYDNNFNIAKTILDYIDSRVVVEHIAYETIFKLNFKCQSRQNLSNSADQSFDFHPYKQRAKRIPQVQSLPQRQHDVEEV